MRVVSIVVVAVLLMASSVSARQEVEVTTCGQVVPRSARGFLTADLNCPGTDPLASAIVLDTNAILDLRGFTLTTAGGLGVFCAHGKPGQRILQGCTVMNGTIHAGGYGVYSNRVRVSDLAITIGAEGANGIVSGSVVRGTNLRVSGASICGVSASTVRLVGSIITSNRRVGICGVSARLIDSAVFGNCTDPDVRPDLGGCSDIQTARPPVLIDSTRR